jgi:hypothetical protein
VGFVVTVKELIALLVDCPQDAEVRYYVGVYGIVNKPVRFITHNDTKVVLS